MDRFERQRALFGDEGQARVAQSRVAIVGVGGLGAFVAMELAYLGVGEIALIDDDVLETSNRNRLVGAWDRHKNGTPKVEIMKELIEAIDPTIQVSGRPVRFGRDADAMKAVTGASVVMGCLDNDGSRLRLNTLCCRAGLLLIDAASDTQRGVKSLAYGGRVTCCSSDTGCLVCFDALDPREVRRSFASDGQRADEDAIYGIERTSLRGSGPSVVSVNGVVASLAVTEFMAAVTGLRKPFAQQEYRGHEGKVFRGAERGDSDCYYCASRSVSATTTEEG